MKFLKISKFLMILILPIILFLLVVSFSGFDSLYYQKKLSEYGVEQEVPKASSLNEKVIDFIKGKNKELPSEFNSKEQQHLWDVRGVVKILTIILYSLIALFILLLFISAFTLKINNYIINFVGKVLLFGGFLTILLAALVFLLINYDFSTAFESFHTLLFQKGTYTFDPAKEVIVKLYPEQFFMDIGAKISKEVIAVSAVIILLGSYLIFKSKNKKNK